MIQIASSYTVFFFFFIIIIIIFWGVSGFPGPKTITINKIHDFTILSTFLSTYLLKEIQKQWHSLFYL